ncbi:MAG: FKBP-type peptidyl-prolyl cis-trans isomerase [Chitinophagales bacterium]|nr:FKBP-type peptidyl-prolyl cis-trans isomerase [Chitinophagales bacterium]
MKRKIPVLFAALLTTGIVMAQQGQKPKTTAKPALKTAAKTVKTAAPSLKTFKDSVSYAFGISFANYYKSQGVKDINTAFLSKAVNDVFSDKILLFDDETANRIMNKYMFQLQAEKVKPAIDSGKSFLEKNKLRPEVKTTASGLQYEVITEGTGEKPTINDTVVCNYWGKLLDGTEFDNSYNRGQPISFPLRNVIRGWTEGLQLMPVGSKYKFYIPYNLAYGEFENGPIPGGSTLIFEVELLSIKKGPAQ